MTAELPEELQNKVQEKLHEECAKFLKELGNAQSRKLFPSVKPGTEQDPGAKAEAEAAMSEPRSLSPTPAPTEMSEEAAPQTGEAAPAGETLPAPVQPDSDQDMKEVPPPKVPECAFEVDLEED